jgi:7-carboxy-7-deazaguanine synthase
MSLYPVSQIFRSLQGEGHFVGYPMTFVRLAGCSVLDCAIRPHCDEAPWKSSGKFRAVDVVDQCKAHARSGIVCITGGEPTDHDLLPLVCALREAGYRVHIETSGARSIEGVPFDWITVSPKVFPFAQRQGHTIKVVVLPEWGDAAQAWGIVHGATDCGQFFHWYLQPLTSPDGSTNIAQVVEMLRHPHNGGGKWALSTQAHKTWGVH